MEEDVSAKIDDLKHFELGSLCCLIAINNFNDSSPVLNDCSFQLNDDFFGGAIYNSASYPAFTNCSFQGNYSDGNTGGGAIYNNRASPALSNCSFQGNDAFFGGGAVYNTSSSPVLANCSFQGNNAAGGGAVDNREESSPVLTNCSFQGNNASSRGGAVYNSSSSPSLTSCFRQSKNEEMVSGSSGLVGSSRNSNLGLDNNSTAMETRFRCPPDNSPTFCLTYLPSFGLWTSF